MAVLHLILQGNTAARGIPELAAVIAKHNDWIAGKKFLLVPYHMIGAHDMESGILGGYVEFIRRIHPDAPIPGVYLAEGLFGDAENLRDADGRRAVLRQLERQVRRRRASWGDARSAAGMPTRFESRDRRRRRARKSARSSSARSIGTFFGSYDTPGRGPRRGVRLARQGPLGHQPARQPASATTP